MTTAQLLALGASQGWIRRCLANVQLVRVRRGVYRVAGTPESREQAWLAAVLEVGDDAVLSHATAAAAWTLKWFGTPDRIDVMTARKGTRPRTPGVRSHQTLWLPDADRSRLRSLPVTSAARTLVDAGRLHPWTLGRVVDDALRRKIVRLPDLVRTFERAPVSGRRPSASMKDVLAERLPGFDPGGSASELEVLGILRGAGIDPLPVQQFQVIVEGHRYVLDYAWEETKHAIEYQGDPHFVVSALHDDYARMRRLTRAGWTVWPTTEHTTRDEYIAIGIEATLGPVR